MLVVGEVLRVLDEADILGHVQLFAEVFYIQTKIDDHLFTIFGISVADQERTGNAGHNSVAALELSLDIVITKECLLLDQTCIILLHEFDQFLTKEGIMNFALFIFDIETH
jgi:hypothetical protein